MSALLHETDMYLRTLDIVQDKNPHYYWLSDTIEEDPADRTTLHDDQAAKMIEDIDAEQDDDDDGEVQSGYGRMVIDAYAVEAYASTKDWYTSDVSSATSWGTCDLVLRLLIYYCVAFL